MGLIKRIWRYLLADPFAWLFYYFAQPARFRQEFETKKLVERILPMLLLVLPIFAVSYLLAFFPHGWIILLGTMGGVVWGIIRGIKWGIVGGIGLSIGLSLGFGDGAFTIANLSTELIGLGCGLGIGLSITGDGILGEKPRRILRGIIGGVFAILYEIISSIWVSLGWGITGGAIGVVVGTGAGAIIGGELKNVLIGTELCALLGIVVGYFLASEKKDSPKEASGSFLKRHRQYIMKCVKWSIAGGFLGGIIGFLFWESNLITLAERWASSSNGSPSPLSFYPSLGFFLISMAGIVAGIILSIVNSLLSQPQYKVSESIRQSIDKQGSYKYLDRGVEDSIGLGFGWGTLVVLTNISTANYSAGIGSVVAPTIVAACFAFTAFAFYYLVGYYRLPLYLASVLSLLRAREDSKKKPPQVFRYLHRCALYWNERMNLPLHFFLVDILSIAIDQDTDQALQEITFIAAERPYQKRSAQAGLVEVIIQDLERRKTLRDIAEASQQLARFLQLGENILASAWKTQFTLLRTTSLNASHYLTSLRWQVRHDILTSIIKDLSKVTNSLRISNYRGSFSIEDRLKMRLALKIAKWLSTTQSELDKLNQEPEKTDQINNPYIVGPVLDQLGTSLFVGRRDLAQQLEQALRRGSQRTTFFLNGERRMGKSSVLKQLPHLLDTRYFLPLFYDLQSPGMLSSAVAFLSTIAEKIYEAVNKDTTLKSLERSKLVSSSQKSEAEVYFVFDEWLKEVERILEQKGWILLLSFDEFEHLEKVGQAKYLDMHLLLSWFRSVIQNRPRFALLFSGGRSISEMSAEAGISWTSYFVNVQTLRVSFLREAEARQLITRPIPEYPIEQIFGEGVVDEIIHVTGCHPFLVQAVCSAVVDNLNADKRDRAVVQDVAIAMNQVLENWEAYFQDLWNRTDQNQRVCLFAIIALGESDQQKIAQQSNLDERIIRRTLEVLRKRDLVIQAGRTYRIAAPIFAEWVERKY